MKHITHKWLWPFLCLTLLFAGACSDDDTETGSSEPVPPTLTTENLPENGFHFVYFKESTRTFLMDVDAPWEITKTDGWFVVTPKAGKAGKNILITVEGDVNEGDARTGEFTIRANSGSYRYPCVTEKTVRLSQDAFLGAGFEITGLEEYQDNIVDFPAEDPQTVTFSVTAPYDWTLTVSDETWVGISPRKGNAGQTTTVTIAPTANTTKEPKSSELTLVCFDPANEANSSEVKLTLRQSRLADLHDVGYVFFEDDFNWITPLWDFTTYNQPYGWPTVDASDFHFYTNNSNTAVGAKAAELGYTFNASTYGRYLGFVKLGKTNENGLLITPALKDIDKDRSATLLVQFDGAYYMTAGGSADTGTSMSVTVVDGGTIIDGKATDEGRTLVIPMRRGFAWDRYFFLVKDATSATKIQFSDGIAKTAIKTRLYLDNVTITRADDDTTEAPAPEAIVEPLTAVVDPADPVEIGPEAQTLAYTVRINRAWEISTDAEWLTIATVTSGTKKGTQGSSVAADKRTATASATALLYDVTLQAAENPGEARTGKVTLKAEGQAIGSIEVKQEKCASTHSLTLTGLDNGTTELGYDKAGDGASVKFTVNSTLDWSIATADTWYAAVPASGKAGEEVEVTLSATQTNRGMRRFGSFVVSTVKPDAEEALSETITVSQKPAAVGSAPWDLATPIRWKFSANDMPKYTPEFSNAKENDLIGNTVNALPSETTDGPGYISYMHNSLDLDINGKCFRIVGATGEPYVTGAWPGDYWMFTIPVRSLPAGTKVHFKGTSKTSGTGQKYWLMEYNDGGTWKPVMQTETTTVGGSEIVYTQEHKNTTALPVDFTVTFENALTDANIQFRYTCAANAQAKAGDPLAAPNGGTHRWQEPLTIEIEQ